MSINRSYVLKALVICGLGAVLKFLYLSMHDFWGIARLPDEINYYLAGASLFKEQGWEYFFTERSLWNAPLNSLWVWLFDANIELIQIANILLVSIGCWLVGIAVARNFGPRAGYLALLAVNLFPPLIELSGTVLSEPLFFFFVSLAFFAVNYYRQFLTAGLALGLACLTRPALLALPGFFLIAYFLLKGSRRYFDLFAWLRLTLGFYLFVAPWLFKNYIVFNEPIIAYGSGAVLYLGNDFKTAGDEPVYSGFQFATSEITKPYTHLDREGDRRLKQEALALIKAEPLEFAKLTVFKFGRLLFGYPASYFYPLHYLDVQQLYQPLNWQAFAGTALQLLTVLLTVGLSVASLLALRLVFVSSSSYFAAALIVYFVGLHSVLFAIPRMLLPALPAFIYLSALFYKKANRSYCRLALILTVVLTLGLCTYGRLVNYFTVSSSYEHFLKDKKEFSDQKLQLESKLDSGRVLRLNARFDEVPLFKNTVVLLKLNYAGSARTACVRFGDAESIASHTKACFTLEAGEEIYRFVLQPLALERLGSLRLVLQGVQQGEGVELKRLVVGW